MSKVVLAVFVGVALAALCLAQKDSSPTPPGDWESKGWWHRMQFGTYCCGNHKPAHCGKREQLDELERLHGCTGWKLQEE